MNAQASTADAGERSARLLITDQDAALLTYIHALKRGACYVIVENGQPTRWGRHRTRRKGQVIDPAPNMAYNAPD